MAIANFITLINSPRGSINSLFTILTVFFVIFGQKFLMKNFIKTGAKVYHAFRNGYIPELYVTI